MALNYNLNNATEEGTRTIERLLALRKQLKNQIPDRTLKETILLATWNIRDFDKPAFGDRLDESIYYIAEIMSHFDLIAVQEVYKDLNGLNRVMAVLGGDWKYIVTDETTGDQGNGERMAFVYDSGKVSFGGLAGELVLPSVKDENGELKPVSQFWRTPFVVGFKAGWTTFMLATVHILWGGQKANSEKRVQEIHHIAAFLKKRTNDKTAWSRNLILLGDFNIFGTKDKTFQQIKDAGFKVPEQLLKFRSNAKKNRHYDQIAFRTRPGRLEKTGKAGVFDYYESVFRDTPEDKAAYMQFMTAFETKKNGKPRTEKSKKIYYQTYWRTHQMSDHLPMWVELKIDYSDEYLENKLT